MIRAGAGVALVGLFAVAALIVIEAVLSARIEGDTNDGAFDAIWSAFVGPLQTSFLIIGGFGVIVASAAASALRPTEHGVLMRRAWRLFATEPTTTRGRLIWAACLVVVGLLMIFESGLVVRLALLIGGAYLLSRAASTVIALAGEPVSADQSRVERRRILAWSGVSVVATAVAGVVLVAILTGGADREHQGLDSGRDCTGSPLLCKRTLDEVAFLGDAQLLRRRHLPRLPLSRAGEHDLASSSTTGSGDSGSTPTTASRAPGLHRHRASSTRR